MIDYEKILSKKVQDIKFSGIRKFFDIAERVQDVISLSIGEPDFKTPWTIRKEAINTLEKGKTTYTSNSGLFELREACSAYFERTLGIKYSPEKQVLVTVGGSEAIDISIRAIVGEGDEVLICEPSFVCYSPIVTLAGGTPVAIETKQEDNFKLTAQALKSKITEKTKMLILPFPNNPTGAVMKRKELEEIAEVLRNTDIIVLSDEIYSELTYGFKHTSIAQIEGMAERTIVINGFSKAFAMTGWRLGMAAGPEEIILQMLKIHQYAIMCSPTVSQYAAIAALALCEKEVQYMVDEYNTRRRLVVKGFNDIGLTCFEPEGAFYAFPCIKSTGLSSEEFCERLIYEQKVAVVPGNAFGKSGEGYIRVSYACSLNNINLALSKIDKFIKSIK